MQVGYEDDETAFIFLLDRSQPNIKTFITVLFTIIMWNQHSQFTEKHYHITGYTDLLHILIFLIPWKLTLRKHVCRQNMSFVDLQYMSYTLELYFYCFIKAFLLISRLTIHHVVQFYDYYFNKYESNNFCSGVQQCCLKYERLKLE